VDTDVARALTIHFNLELGRVEFQIVVDVNAGGIVAHNRRSPLPVSSRT
jgi:hypothetical protein